MFKGIIGVVWPVHVDAVASGSVELSDRLVASTWALDGKSSDAEISLGAVTGCGPVLVGAASSRSVITDCAKSACLSERSEVALVERLESTSSVWWKGDEFDAIRPGEFHGFERLVADMSVNKEYALFGRCRFDHFDKVIQPVHKDFAVCPSTVPVGQPMSKCSFNFFLG